MAGSDFHAALGKALLELGNATDGHQKSIDTTAWESFISFLASGFFKLREGYALSSTAVGSSSSSSSNKADVEVIDEGLSLPVGKSSCCRGTRRRRLYRVAWVPKTVWDEHFKDLGRCLLFCSIQRVYAEERLDALLPVQKKCVACVFEFDEIASAEALTFRSGHKEIGSGSSWAACLGAFSQRGSRGGLLDGVGGFCQITRSVVNPLPSSTSWRASWWKSIICVRNAPEVYQHHSKALVRGCATIPKFVQNGLQQFFENIFRKLVTTLGC